MVTIQESRDKYIRAGFDFLTLQTNTVAGLRPPGVELLWNKRRDYLADLLNYTCDNSLRALEIRVGQIRSSDVEVAKALHWWFFDKTWVAIIKLGYYGEHPNIMENFISQVDEHLIDLKLTRIQRLALWGIRLQKDLTDNVPTIEQFKKGLGL